MTNAPVGIRSQRQSWTWVVLASALLVAILPMLAHPHLPLIDLPNHIARHYIAANSGTALDAYYSYTFALSGNSAGDLLWLAVGQHFADVYTFSAILMALYAGNLVMAAAVLGRVFHGKWSIWPLAALLVVFNTPFFWGFQNFLLTVPIALYALAAWIHQEETPPVRRAIFFVPAGVVLFELHNLGFVVFLACAFGREVHRLLQSGTDWRGHILRHCVSALPFLLPLGIALSDVVRTAPNEYGDLTRYGSLYDRLYMLTSPVDAVLHDESGALAVSGWLSLTALAVAFLTLRRKTGLRLVVASRAVGPIVALAVLCLAAPAVLDGVGLVHVRFPFVLCVVAIAGTAWREFEPRQAAALLVVFAALAVGRAVAVERFAARHSVDLKDLSAVLSAVPDGSRLIPVRMSGLFSSPIDWHLQAHAIPRAHAFVPTLFLGAHSLDVNDGWRHMTAAQGPSIPAHFVLGADEVALEGMETYWQDWQTGFTHVLALDNLTDELTAAKDLRLLDRRGRFEVYAIEK
jgi:hypothetical protein